MPSWFASPIATGWNLILPLSKSSRQNLATSRAQPVPLFATRIGGAVGQNVFSQNYMVSPNGQRFLMNNIIEETTSPITVLLNWKAKP